MRIQRVALGLTIVNLVLLAALLAEQVRPAFAEEVNAQAEGVAPVLRARSLEIVDEQNRVRALLAVMPATTVDGKGYPETVLLRLIDPKSGPVVKLTAAENGSALGLSDDADSGVAIFARDDGSFVKVTDKTGNEEVLKP